MLYVERNIAISAPFDKAFDYLTDMTRMPEWTNAFAEVSADGSALLRTPEGEVPVTVEDTVNRDGGIIDTKITFPDGSSGWSYSRLYALDDNTCVYSFVLTPPPVALEELEGALSEQAQIIEQELQTLKLNLEN